MKRVIMFPAKVLRPIYNYLKSVQKRLERKKKDLKSEDPFSDPSRVNDNAATDADAAEISGHDRVEALRREVDRRLIQVRKSLAKIRRGKYGSCENCGRLINTDRLSVNPTAELCMKCERKRKE